MSITDWSEDIYIVQLADEPAFSEDMDTLISRLVPGAVVPDIILDMKAVTYLNSSNLSQLLQLRNILQRAGSRLRVCSVRDSVWSVLLVAGLDGVFDFTGDVSTALASLQIER